MSPPARNSPKSVGPASCSNNSTPASCLSNVRIAEGDMRSSAIERAFTSTEASASDPLCDNLRFALFRSQYEHPGSRCMKHGAIEVQSARSRDNHLRVDTPAFGAPRFDTFGINLSLPDRQLREARNHVDQQLEESPSPLESRLLRPAADP